MAARKTDGDAAGTRALIEVLLLHRSMAAADVVAGLTAALRVGAVSADVVAVEARRYTATSDASKAGEDLVPSVTAGGPRVVSMTQRRLTDPAAVIAGLPADTRPLPSVVAYDELLTLARRPHQKTSHPTEETG